MNYPITRTQMTMPGTSGGIKPHLSFDTGEAEMWKAVGKLAGAGMQTVGKIHTIQAEQQFMDATLRAEEEMARLSVSLSKNTDENTYDAELQKSIGNLRKNMPKNPLAARIYDNWIKKQTVGWKQDIEEAKYLRLKHKWTATELELIDKSIKTRSITPLRIHEEFGISQGFTTEDLAQKVLTQTRNSMEYEAGLSWSITDPNGLLDAIKVEKGETKLEGFDTLSSGQVIALRANAVGTLDFRRGENQRRLSINNEALEKLALDETITPQKALETIKTFNATAAEKIEMYSRFMDSRKAIAEGRGNPFKVTTDYTIREQMKNDAIDGKMTEEKIRKAVGKSISSDDGDELRKIMNRETEASAKAFEDTRAAKFLSELLNDYSRVGVFDQVKIEILREKGYRLLQDAIDKADPPMTDREKKEKALSIYNSLIRELPGLTTEPSELLTPEDIAKRNKYFVGRGLTPGEFAGTKPVNITKTATNPKTGERVGWNGEKWIKL